MVEIAIRNNIFGPIINVCSRCGSGDVISLYWLNLNSMKIIEKAEMYPETPVCLNCKSQTTVITKQQFIENLEKRYDTEEYTLETVSAGMQEENQGKL